MTQLRTAPIRTIPESPSRSSRTQNARGVVPLGGLVELEVEVVLADELVDEAVGVGVAEGRRG